MHGYNLWSHESERKLMIIVPEGVFVDGAKAHESTQIALG
jgi:hypothetical protein